MMTCNQMACSHCNSVGKLKLIEPKTSKYGRGFAKVGFQKTGNYSQINNLFHSEILLSSRAHY